MTPSVRTLLALGSCGLLTLVACSSISRGTTSSGTPWWEADGSGPVATAPADTARIDAITPADPQDEAAPVLLADTRTGEGLDPVKPDPPTARPLEDSLSVEDSLSAQLSPEALAARREAYGARTHAERDRVRRVNEYAFWCLDRGMWDEARIHLEQAVQIDSLAASLHNNLGIVYERMGQRDEARARYRTAADLNPGRPLYEANLSRLHAAIEQPRATRSDSLSHEDLLIPPRGDYRPHVGATPIENGR